MGVFALPTFKLINRGAKMGVFALISLEMARFPVKPGMTPTLLNQYKLKCGNKGKNTSFRTRVLSMRYSYYISCRLLHPFPFPIPEGKQNPDEQLWTHFLDHPAKSSWAGLTRLGATRNLPSGTPFILHTSMAH